MSNYTTLDNAYRLKASVMTLMSQYIEDVTGHSGRLPYRVSVSTRVNFASSEPESRVELYVGKSPALLPGSFIFDVEDEVAARGIIDRLRAATAGYQSLSARGRAVVDSFDSFGVGEKGLGKLETLLDMLNQGDLESKWLNVS